MRFLAVTLVAFLASCAEEAGSPDHMQEVVKDLPAAVQKELRRDALSDARAQRAKWEAMSPEERAEIRRVQFEIMQHPRRFEVAAALREKFGRTPTDKELLAALKAGEN